MSDLAIGLRLTADGSAMVGTTKLAREEIDKLAESTRKAGNAAEKFSSQQKSVAKETGEMGSAARLAGVAIGGVVLAAGAYALALGAGAVRTIALANEMATLSSRTGQSVEQLSMMRFVLEQNNATLNDYVLGIKTLSNRMYDAVQNNKAALDTFTALGISQQFLRENLNNVDAVVLRMADRFSTMKNGAGKNALAFDALGDASRALLPTLNQGAEAMAQLTEEGRKWSEISEATAQASNDLNNNISALKFAAEGAGRKLADYFLPALVDITSEMRAAAQEGGVLSSILVGIGLATRRAFGFSSTRREAADERAKDLFDSIRSETVKLQKLEESLKASGGVPFRDNTVERKIKQLREKIAADKEDLKSTLAYRDSLLTKPKDETAQTEPPDKPANPKKTGAGGNRGESFLDSLDREIEKVGQGEEAYLRLKAAQLGVSAAADGRITKLIAAKKAQEDETNSTKAYNDQLIRSEEAQIASRKTADEFAQAKREQIDQIKLETSVLGQSAIAQRLTMEAARLDLEIRKESLKILPEERAEFLKKAQVLRGEYLTALNDAYDASRTFEAGVKTAMETYRDEANNTAAQTSRVLSNGFRKAEDALVNFAKTGKLNFRDFADSVITDLLRIQAQKAVSGFAENVLGKIFSGGVGGVSAGSQQAVQLNDQWSIVDTIATIFQHTGGGPGDAPMMTRMMPTSTFFNAPRFHSGIGAGEQAAVIRKDEAVLTPGQMRMLAPAGAGGGITIHQPINVTVQSTGDEKLDGEKIAASLKNSMQKIVDTTLLRERRPGGMLA